MPIFAWLVRPWEGVGVGNGVVERDKAPVDGVVDVVRVDSVGSVDVAVIKVVAGGVVNVLAGVRIALSDEMDVGDGRCMVALLSEGGVVTDVIVGGALVMDVAVMVEETDIAVMLEETDIEVAPPTVAARLMPCLSVQQVVLVLPQHQVPSLHRVSPMLPDTP